MSEIAVAITDPNGRRWAQLLDHAVPVRHLIPLLAERLQLPGKLNYQLISAASQQPIGENLTLAQAGIYPGMELYLRPVRDHLLKMLLDKLYDEVEGHVKDQLWELAKQKLETLFSLDPSYPDPRRLKEVVFTRVPAVTAAMGAPETPPSAQPTRARVSGKRPRSGCIVVAGLAIGGVVLIAGAAMTLVLLGALSGSHTDGVSTIPRPTDVILGTGDVQVTLRWDNAADLDLHVIDPFGEEIWYGYQISNSGGQLDVDANADCDSYAAQPVENVFWPYGQAPTGQYQVYVHYFLDCNGSGSTSYQVTVKVDDRVIDTASGTLNQPGDEQYLDSFSR